ncbi:glycosyltransferase family 4 protein [Clostridium frigoris]|uniref:Glycosyltransferase family 4 protein n=1 Tax=Clostridium frigoris TaxID=205327 RepID=A0ABS6BV36_9CLOT|nr:glycosyltransferase family 4 protein [Clostridium frigoris]MBU3159849.1 glycosyltransferase family 4 protein [Clostridium frigoris]
MAEERELIENNKKIWTFHHYATLPNLNGHIRPYNFGKYMKDRNIEMTIFAASYLHFSNRNLISDNRKCLTNDKFGIPFVFINTPSSKSARFARVKNMLAFYFRLFGITKKYEQIHGKPDVIIASSPQPLAMIAGIQIAKKYKVPCICEIRDLWPEAIFAVSNLKEKSLIGRLLTAGEHWIYKKADALIFTKEGDTDYIKEKGWDTDHGGDIDLKKCHYINNGVDLDAYIKSIDLNKLDDPDLETDKFNVVYAGAIRTVNNVGNIIDAAKLLKEEKDIQFLIYGDGNQVEALKQRIVDEALTNVKIKGFVEKKYIPYILSKSSVNILNYSQTKYNWTRGNSSNKLFEYMSSGKPVISTVKMGYCILDKYKCGLSLEKSTQEELSKAILKVRDMPKEQYEKLCLNARNGAKDFDYKVLTTKLIDVIECVESKETALHYRKILEWPFNRKENARKTGQDHTAGM